MFDPALFDPEEERRRRRFLIPGAEEVGEQEVDVDGDATQGVASNPPNDARAGAYYVGPATRRYAEHLEAMPKQQPPGKLRRILAGLAGASSGYFGGTEAGVTSARDVLNEPYNRAMQRWGVEAGGRKTAADLERQGMTAETAASSQRMRELLAYIRALEAGKSADAAALAARLRTSPGGLYNVEKGAIEPGTAPPARIPPPITPGQMIPDPTRPGEYKQIGTPRPSPYGPEARTFGEDMINYRTLRESGLIAQRGAEARTTKGTPGAPPPMAETGQEAYANQVQAAREIVTRDARYAPFFLESAAAAPGTLGFGAKPAQTARILTQGEVPQDRASQQLFREFLSKIEARISGMGRRARTAPPVRGRNPNVQEIGVR
jgi:hypothetical protein